MRRLARCLLLVTVVALVGAPAPGAAQSGAQRRVPLAVWVWSPQAPAALLDFARGHHLDEVFLATPTAPTGAETRRLRRSVRLLHDDGVRVSALGGGKAWVRQPDQALTWARAALSAADFDGLHLDVEPHAFPGWTDPGPRAHLIRDYLALLDDVGPLSERVVVDVQFAYGSYDAPGDGRRTFADAILQRVDEVTVLSYRDTARGPNSLQSISRDWLRRAALAGVPVRLAVETNPSSEGEHVTFAEEGRAAMHHVIGTVDAVLRGTGAYVGFAVHDLAGWRALGP